VAEERRAEAQPEAEREAVVAEAAVTAEAMPASPVADILDACGRLVVCQNGGCWHQGRSCRRGGNRHQGE
jgi:hypothetical protein